MVLIRLVGSHYLRIRSIRIVPLAVNQFGQHIYVGAMGSICRVINLMITES